MRQYLDALRHVRDSGVKKSDRGGGSALGHPRLRRRQHHGVFFGMLPDGAGRNVFGPIFDLFAQNPNAINQFKADMKKAVAGLPNM